MNLSPVEAINRVNDSVTVEMLVQRTKSCSGSRQVFLDSETNPRDPKNLGVVVTELLDENTLGGDQVRPRIVPAAVVEIDPAQRPARALSPGRTARVQCVHPMLG